MTREELQSALDAETSEWSSKPLQSIVEALRAGELNYDRETASGVLQFAVTLLESKSDYIHVAISVDDGSLKWSTIPLTSSFIARSDGRVDG